MNGRGRGRMSGRGRKMSDRRRDEGMEGQQDKWQGKGRKGVKNNKVSDRGR